MWRASFAIWFRLDAALKRAASHTLGGGGRWEGEKTLSSMMARILVKTLPGGTLSATTLSFGGDEREGTWTDFAICSFR